MVSRWRLTIAALCTLLVVSSGDADIYRWDTGDVIPGTEEITPRSFVNLSYWEGETRNLRFADFSGGIDLYGALFDHSWLDDALFTGANLSTASLSNSTLTRADLSGAKLTSARLYESNLTGANLSGANLTNTSLNRSIPTDASLSDAVVRGTNFRDTTSRGFSKEQLDSTASYERRNLQGIQLCYKDLTAWDFAGRILADAVLDHATLVDANLSGANFTNASLDEAILSNANLSGANLANAYLWDARDLSSAIVDSATVYNQWTQFPRDFSPEITRMTFKESPVGDFNGNDVLEVLDVDLLMARFAQGPSWRDQMLDLNGDRSVTKEDLQVWINDLKSTWFGDANLDGEFNTHDLVQVFQAGRYETEQARVGPKATGTATASLTAATSLPPSKTAATNRGRG